MLIESLSSFFEEDETHFFRFRSFVFVSLSLFPFLLQMYAAAGDGDWGGQQHHYGSYQQHDETGAAAAAEHHGPDDADALESLDGSITSALGDASANASLLASTPASDEASACRLTAAVQKSLASARASMRDLELFAEEEDS